MCKTFSPANQIAQSKFNDEKLELYMGIRGWEMGDTAKICK